MNIIVTGISPESRLTHNGMEYPLGSIIKNIEDNAANAYIESKLAEDVDKMGKEKIEQFQRHVLFVHKKRQEFIKKR